MNLKESYNERYIGIILFIISIILFLITISKVNLGLNVDEAFSLMITNTNFFETINLTAQDVHPPLYYIFLKIFLKIFNNLNINPIISSQYLSMIPILCLLIIDYLKVRKEFGWLACGIFAVCITSMPNFMYYTLTIRMYSFAMFFVFMVFLIAYDIIKYNNLKSWILITIFTIASFYTHYYAAITCSIIYLLLLIYFIYNNKTQIKFLIISFIVSILAYTPWIYIIFTQINKYHDNYWIPPKYSEQLIETFWYIFSSYTTSSMIIGVLLVISILILIYKFIIDKNKEDNDYYAITGLSIIVLTILCGLLISVSVMPLFNQRYVFPALGIFWLGFSILLAKNFNNKKIFAFCIIILLCASGINTLYYVNSSDICTRNMEILDSNVTFEDGDIIIHDNKHTKLTYERWYCPQCSHYDYSNSNMNFTKIINDALANNHSVWIFYRDSGDTRLRGSDGTILNDFSRYYEFNQVVQLEPDPYNNLPTGIYKIELSNSK